jgi:hypothetical protein
LPKVATPALPSSGGAAPSSLWPRVIIETDGLTVVNLLPRRIKWQDISGVEWRPWGRRGGTYLLGLRLANGKRIAAWGVSVNDFGFSPTFAMYEDVLARWQTATGGRDAKPPQDR